MILLFIFLFGLIIGSFLNVLIFRMHDQKTVLGRSQCRFCNKKIAWYDNIPVISFFLLKRKCRNCKKSISWQYILIELTTAILFVLIFLRTTHYRLLTTDYDLSSLQSLELLTALFFISILIIIFVYDLRHYLILDRVTLPAIVIIFLLNLMLGVSWYSMVISGIIGAGFFYLQFIVSQGRWIGGGDIRLGALIGVALGLKLLILTLFVAYILGAIVGVVLVLLKKKKLSGRMPFGTFLAFSAVLSLLYGDSIIQWYLKFIF